MQMEGRMEVELTANPKADALCLMNETAAERERAVSTHWSVFISVASFMTLVISITLLQQDMCIMFPVAIMMPIPV